MVEKRSEGSDKAARAAAVTEQDVQEEKNDRDRKLDREAVWPEGGKSETVALLIRAGE